MLLVARTELQDNATSQLAMCYV